MQRYGQNHYFVAVSVFPPCETWNLSECDKNRLRVWERKVLRKIFGAVCEQSEGRIRTNDEVNKLYGDLELIAEVKKRRLQYLGHVVRTEEGRVPKKIEFVSPLRPQT
jgi:hypothetical protein